MKPIAKGCLAVVIGGVDCGTEVTVGKFLGEHPPCVGKDLWEVNKPMLFAGVVTGRERLRYLCPERLLMRIDGYEKEQTTEREKEVVV